jgi:hypothetical protein
MSSLGAADAAPQPQVSTSEQAGPIKLTREQLLLSEQVARDISTLLGRRDALRARDAELIEKVGIAKARVADKSEVEKALELLQQRAHQRSVGDFEQMLTAATDDVLSSEANKGQRQIRLELTIERNMPALDIFAQNRGSREDITSGAVANVVSTGLRFIALARSVGAGARPFLALDEADCWIEHSGAVQNYFNMVDQLSQQAGMQVLVITHHDVSDFAERFRIYRIADVDSQDPWPARAMDLMSAGQMQPSDLQDNWLSWMQLENFESFPHARIELSPGVTVINGPNEHGKSGWMRALRSAFMADAGDGIIRHGKPNAAVSIGFSDGRVLQYRRVRKGNPKAEFILHSEASWNDFQSGLPMGEILPLHHTAGAKLPDWVPRETGIRKIDDIDVQLHGQLVPVFMLGEAQTPSKRASLLSIGRESGYLCAMNEVYKDDQRADGSVVKDGERELAAIRLTLEQMEELPQLVSEIERLQALGREIQQESAELAELDQLTEGLRKNREAMAIWAAEAEVLAALPEAPALQPTERLDAWFGQYTAAKEAAATPVPPMPPAQPAVEATAEIDAWLAGLRDAVEAKALSATLMELPEVPTPLPTAEVDLLANDLKTARLAARTPVPPMPPEAPAVEPTDDVDVLLRDLRSTRNASEAWRRQLVDIEQKVHGVEKILSLASEALGNECPVCHSYMDADVLLGHKQHEHAAPKP